MSVQFHRKAAHLNSNTDEVAGSGSSWLQPYVSMVRLTPVNNLEEAVILPSWEYEFRIKVYRNRASRSHPMFDNLAAARRGWAYKGIEARYLLASSPGTKSALALKQRRVTAAALARSIDYCLAKDSV